MHTNFFAAIMFLVSIAMAGCGSDTASGPFGAPSASPLMTPCAGTWTFDLDKTLDAQKAAGVTDERIAQLRKLFADNQSLGKMHPDLTFDGNVAVGAGLLSSEYRFFGMHTHGSKICGKAWHHEDRHDPGDMSKCYVRLEIIEGALRMEVNMQDGLPDLNDSDLQSDLAVEGDLAKCEVDSKAGSKPGGWATYVFTRRP